MPMLLHKPAPPLSELVDVFWYIEGSAAAGVKERALPTGTVELVISLASERVEAFGRHDLVRPKSARGLLVCGPHSEYFVTESEEYTRLIGVHFKPGGASSFLALPANELCNLHAGLDDVWGLAAYELREKLLAAASPALMFGVLERELLSQVRGSFETEPVVAFAIRELDAGASVASITQRIGTSANRFAKLFAAQVGLSPKRYQRVSRFQRVVRTIGDSTEADWTGIAYDCGYFDQAHFIKDFEAFCGLTPSAYLRSRTERRNHVTHQTMRDA